MGFRALLAVALLAASANHVSAQDTSEQVPAPEASAEPTPTAPDATEAPAPETAAESAAEPAPTAPEAAQAEAPAAEPATEPPQQPAWPDQAASNAPAPVAPAPVAPAPAPVAPAPAQPAVQPVAAAEANKPQPPAADAKSDEGKKARDENPMGWAGLTFKLGFAGIHSSDLPNPTYRPDLAESLSMLPQEQREQYGFGSSCSVITERCKLDGRYGLRLALAINLGGDGFGWDIEPYLALSSMAKAYGIYTGPKFDIHILDSLYVGFGLGLKGAWLVTDDWDFGADLYARLPLRATWYAVDNLALVFEFAFSVGASGYISQAETVTNPITGSEFRTSPEMNFGAGKAWDASVGFRFP